MNLYKNGTDSILEEEIELFKSNGKFNKPKPKYQPPKKAQSKTQPEKFDIKLNEEQKAAKKLILENDVIILTGKSGSGKTLLACQAALDAFFRNDIEKIYITRPTVSKEELGFLPGDMKDKMDPWLRPVYENLDAVYGRDRSRKKVISDLLSTDQIEISPIAYMRGRTKTNSYIIVDECQNITKEQMTMILTRLGKGSKLIFCGDSNQVDLKRISDSGLNYLINKGMGIKGFCCIELKQNHRHSIVDEFIERFNQID